MANDAISPLAEAEADSLEILFNKNPLDLTPSDLDRIIGEMRRIRAKLAASPPKATRAKADKKAELSLDDII